MLPLDLMDLCFARSPYGELNASADLASFLDRHRVDLALQHVQELASGPSAFVAVAELVGLTTAKRAHSLPPKI